MDSVYVLIKNPPQKLSLQEMVIAPPSFLEEVKACFKKKGNSATLGPNYLRAIAEEIGRRYDRNFNAYRNVVPHDYTGKYCASDEDVALVVHEMFQARYPIIYQKYYESLIRERPFDVRVIYFTGNEKDESVFFRLGIRKIDIKDTGAYLTVALSNKEPEIKQLIEQEIDDIKKTDESNVKNLELAVSKTNLDESQLDVETSGALGLLAEIAQLNDKPVLPSKSDRPSGQQRRSREQRLPDVPVNK